MQTCPVAKRPCKYRRLVVRWERISACFDAFLAIATIHIWINRILLVG